MIMSPKRSFRITQTYLPLMELFGFLLITMNHNMCAVDSISHILSMSQLAFAKAGEIMG